MDVYIYPNFTYTAKWHKKNELFWLIVDNEDEILHMESFTIKAKQVVEQ